MSRPSRLWKKVPGTWTTIFNIFSSQMPFILSDDQVTGYTIHRGAGERGGGYTASVLEFTTPEPALRTSLAGYSCTLKITETAATAMCAGTGIDPATIQDRWTGRLAVVEVHDQGDKSALTTTTVRGTSWLTQMLDSTWGITPTAGTRIKAAAEAALRIDTGNALRGITMTTSGVTDRIALTEDQPLRWADFLSKYIADPGYVLRQRRNGGLELMTLTHMQNLAAVHRRLPLVRSRAIRPAQWTIHSERPPRRYVYTHTLPAGGTGTNSYELENNVDEINATENVDFTYLYSDTDQLHKEIRSRVYGENIKQFRIPTVTVDLLTLFGSPHEYHRRLAVELLAMEPYDPVPLSGDWPWQVKGIHYAAGITETITPQAWTLDLSLVPHAQMTGDPSPEPKAYLWDQMTDPWAETTPTWAQHALPPVTA